MATFLITFENPASSQDGSKLTSKIRQDYTLHAHVMDSAWLVRSDDPVDRIRDNLLKVLGPDDKILVAGINGDCAWSALDDDGGDWLMHFYS